MKKRTSGEKSALNTGRHRIAAVESLGWTDIDARVVPLDGLLAELAEIDENLEGPDLSVMERGEHLARWKEIHEALHPETKHGSGPGRGHKEKSPNNSDSFAKASAEKLNVSRQTIEQEIQIARDIPDDLKDEIRDTELADRKVDLLALDNPRRL